MQLALLSLQETVFFTNAWGVQKRNSRCYRGLLQCVPRTQQAFWYAAQFPRTGQTQSRQVRSILPVRWLTFADGLNSNVLSIGTTDSAQAEKLLEFVRSCMEKVEKREQGIVCTNSQLEVRTGRR